MYLLDYSSIHSSTIICKVFKNFMKRCLYSPINVKTAELIGLKLFCRNSHDFRVQAEILKIANKNDF